VAVPGYEILKQLGRGGMGVVYQARHLRLGRVVALKMILAGGHASEADLVRFLAEAEVVAGLQHRHVVQLYEFGRHEGLPYFTLEFVGGGSLADKLRAALRHRPRPPGSSSSWPGASTTPTSTASFIETSSPATCCWPRTAHRRSRISGWPSASRSAAG
jgi:serine/threonine protein kinase